MRHMQWKQKKIVSEEQKLIQQQGVISASMRKKQEAAEFESFRAFEEEMKQA